MGLSILLITFIVISSINCIYLFFLLSFTFQKKKAAVNSAAVLSVFVYIKNEADALPAFLERITNLDEFRQSQFLFVNHASHDDSEEILERFVLKHSNTTLVNVENKEAFWDSKRYALTLGMKQASHTKMMFISPNTIFEDDHWLNQTHNALTKEFLIGYNGFSKEKGFLNKIARFYSLCQETYHLGLGGSAKVSVLNDTNIGYTSSLFFENNGFNNRLNQNAGVQSLLYRDIGKTTNTTISKNIATRKTYSFVSWKLQQTNRWNTFFKSSFATKFLFIVFQSTQYLFWPLFILGCVFMPSPLLFSVAAIRILLQGFIYIKNGIDFNEKDTLYYYPFIELLSLILGVYLFLSHLFSKKS